MIALPKTIGSVLACLAIAATASGCGEKEEPATTGAQVTQGTSTTSTTTTGQQTTTTSAPQVVSLFLRSPDAQRVCDELLTPGFLRKAYGDRTGCVNGRKASSLAKSVANMTVTPGAAETVATVTPKGGVYDGQRLRITLIKDGTGERIDAIRSNVPVGP